MSGSSSRLHRGVGSLALLAASSALSILAALALLAGIESWRGADLPDLYFAEPRPILWVDDLELGFRNRPHLEHSILGNLSAKTNGAGFRSDSETASPGPEGRLRIFGIGDSVMWGTRVRREETFLALIERSLARRVKDVEVVNAGVVGFSTYQERLLFERITAEYAPDVVLVNLHTNDYLPSEDPFDNVRAVYAAYLQRLGSPEPPGASRLRHLLQQPQSWPALRTAIRDPNVQRNLRALLIDRPIRDMARIAAERRVRLIYLLIPPTREAPVDRALRLQVRALLEELGVAFIDFSSILEPGRLEAPMAEFEESSLARTLGRASVSEVLARLSLGALDPVPRLRNLSRLEGIESAHEQSDFIDRVGHPSRRGNRRIAEAILAYLSDNGIPASGE